MAKSWDEILRANLMNNVRNTPSPEFNIKMLLMAVEMRKSAPIYQVDMNTFIFLHDLGKDLENNHKLNSYIDILRLPYPTIIIEISADNVKHMLNDFIFRDSRLMKIIWDYGRDDDRGIKVLNYAQIKESDAMILPQAEELYKFDVNDNQENARCLINLLNENSPIFKGKDRIEKANDFINRNKASIEQSTYFLLGFLLAMNTKSMLELEKVPASKKNIISKNWSGCINISEHTNIKLSLKAKQHREYMQAKASGDRRASRMHLRRGHFKKCKTGLYWWNAHIACKSAEHIISHDYQVSN